MNHQQLGLYDGSDRPYIRMSEAGDCRLKIAFRITGMHEQRRGNPRTLALGTALEPLILAQVPETLHHTGDDQMEITLENPARVGHPDGFTVDGQLVESKSMNAEHHAMFELQGLAGNSLMDRYMHQVQQYLGWQNEIADDGTPTDVAAAMVVGFNKDLGVPMGVEDLTFQFIDFDPDFYYLRQRELRELEQTLQAGDLPQPDHDGTAEECGWCGFQDLCPAFQEAKDTKDAEGVQAEEVEDEELDLLCASFIAGKARQVTLREEIGEVIGSHARKIRTPNHAIDFVERSGRRSVDQEALKARGVEIPFKVGKAYTELTVKEL